METSRTTTRAQLLAALAAAALAVALALGAVPPPAYAVNGGGGTYIAGSVRSQDIAADAPTLATMAFRSGGVATAAEYTLKPAFDPQVREYMVAVPDNVAQSYFFASLGEGAEGSVAVTYMDNKGSEQTKTVGASGNVSLTNSLRNGSSVGNTLTVTVAGEEAYSVTVVRTPTLLSLGVSTNTAKAAVTPATFNVNTLNYTANVVNGEEVFIIAEPRSTGASVKINGVEAASNRISIVPNFSEADSIAIPIEAYNDNGSSSVYTLTLSEAAAIRITKAPDKVDYAAGEMLDTTGMEVTAMRTSQDPVVLSEGDYKVADQGPVTPSMTEFIVTYNGQQASQSITVSNEEAVPERLRIFSGFDFKTGTTSPPPSSLALTEEFDPTVKYHELGVYDALAGININPTLVDPETASDVEIKADYTDSSNQHQSTTIYPGSDNYLSLFRPNNYTGKALTLTVNGEEAYVFEMRPMVSFSSLKMTRTSNDVSVQFPEGYRNSAYYFAHDYDVNAAADESFSTTVSPRSASDTSVFLNGEPFSNGIVTPAWDEMHNYDMRFEIVRPGCLTGVYTFRIHETPESLELVKAPGITAYTAGDTFDPTGALLKAVYANGSALDVTSDMVSWEFETVPFGCEAVQATYGGLSVSIPLNVSEPFEGAGTEEEPFQIAVADDYAKLRDMVNGGVSVEGLFFKQVADITLPEGWTPMGVTKDGSENIASGDNLNPFDGTLDGGGFTVTVPAGCPPLVGYIRNAEVRNLSIYGERIEGYGLVNNFEGVGLSGQAIIIDNVTIKSGSNVVKSGLIGANVTTNPFAGVSAAFQATVRNCTVEEGVVVGCDGDSPNIGSIAGRMNGPVENCVSYATVKGTNNVGGLVAMADQMAPPKITDSAFHGTVEATGYNVGGIMGAGYIHTTAPNANPVFMDRCECTGVVSGDRFVGGILGSEGGIDDAWGPAGIQNCAFTGQISGNEGVGGVIGYQRSLNKNNTISGNYYKSGCGADKGIGLVHIVDTSGVDHAEEGKIYGWHDGALYYDSSKLTNENKRDFFDQIMTTYQYGSGRAYYENNYRENLQRDDDPLGVDAEKLCFSDEQLADYSAVEVALAEVPEGFEDAPYTDASIQALKDAIAAAGQYKPVWEQDAVNAIAQAIADAIVGLEVDVDKAVAAAEAAANDAQDKAEAAQAAADAATAAADKAAKSGTAEDAAAAVKAADDAKQAAAEAQAAADAAKGAAEVARTAAAGDQGALDRANAAADKAEAAAGKASAAAKAAQTAAEAAAAAQAAAAAPKDNPMRVTAKSVKVKAKKLKKKAQTVDAVAVAGAQGEVTYKIAKIKTKKKLAKQAKKKIKMAENGKLKLKKKLKKGTYKVAVKVTAAGNASYKAATRTVVVKVKVK